MQEQERLWQVCWFYSSCLNLLFVKEGGWFNEKFNDNDRNFLGAPVSVRIFDISTSSVGTVLVVYEKLPWK